MNLMIKNKTSTQKEKSLFTVNQMLLSGTNPETEFLCLIPII